MKKWISRINLGMCKTILMFLPLLFAFVGYMIYYRDADVISALYSSLRIYLVSTDYSLEEFINYSPYDQTVMRVCFECARWLGLCVTATFITKMLRETFIKLKVSIRARCKNSIALHGSKKYVELIKENFGSCAIVDDVPEKFRASKHILAFESDLELLKYLDANFTRFKGDGLSGQNRRGGVKPADKSVYLCMVSSPRTEYLGRGFVINNMAEDCARIYWNKLYVRRFSNSPERRVVILGFGNYGRALFKQALFVNVFPEASMEYHIFGDSEAFQHLYDGISRFLSIGAASDEKDAVFFHRDLWEQNLPLLMQADRVVLADDSDEVNIHALSILFDLGVRNIHIRASNAKLIQELWPGIQVLEYAMDADVCVFGTEDSLYTKEIIMDELLLETAKKIHARYMRRVGIGKCANCTQTSDITLCTRTCEHFDGNWSQMNRFLQEANIAQADHMPVKVRQLLKRDCEINEASLQEYKEQYGAIRHNIAQTEPLAELEHMRWMRHLFFYGWEYAPERNNAAKKHHLLLSFEQLPESQIPKDLDAYEAIVDIMP